MIRTSALSFFVAAAALVACGGPEPKSQQSLLENGVPANSLSEKRLAADDKKAEPKPTPTESKPDPTQPYMQSMGGGAASGDDSAPAGAAAPSPAPGKPGKPGKGGKVSKAECGQAFDKYLELAMGSDPRLDGIPPELLQQAKAQARQQKGDPCDKESVPRSKYNCAMAATTTQQWEKCMK